MKLKIPSKINFSQFALALVRPGVRPSHSPTTHAPYLTTSTPPTPRYIHNRPPSMTFVRLPLVLPHVFPLDYYRIALRVYENVLSKTDPDTLRTIMNIATVYNASLQDFAKAEEMYRFALDGYEKLLGKDHQYTKKRAMNLAGIIRNEKEKMNALQAVPSLGDRGWSQGEIHKRFHH